MIKKERQDRILEIIKARKYCTVNFLSKQLFVAPITIRRDLTEMEQNGMVTRSFGGATLPDYENREVPFQVRSKSNPSVKDKIARQAAERINTGDVVFLDGSSTVSRMVDYLTPEQELTVVTNSMLIAERLNEKHIRCYLTGGMTVENSHSLTGRIAEQMVSNMYANVCFFSAQGIDDAGVISDHSEAETALRKMMIKHSKKQYFLVDSSKLGKRFAFRTCDLSDITDIITDAEHVVFANA